MSLFYTKDSQGNPRLGIAVYIIIILLILVPSFLLFQNPNAIENIFSPGKANQEPPKVFQADQSEKALQEGISAELVEQMEREQRIAQEQQSGLRPEDRTGEIEEKYQERARQQADSAGQFRFGERLTEFITPEATPTPAPTEGEAPPAAPSGFMTMAERLKLEGKSATGGSSSGFSKEFSNQVPQSLQPQQPTTTTEPSTVINGVQTQISNLLPLGTFIACVLNQDVRSTDLQPYIWANVVLDSTFRRQLQLPKGLVRLRGKAAREPVQNLLDIHFDVMVFSDGTELPINGNAYSAFDIRYPDAYRLRGIPGEMVVPPFFLQVKSLVYAAALGASNAYIDDVAARGLSQTTTFGAQPVVDPETGQVTTQITDSVQGGQVQNNLGEVIALDAAQGVVEQLAENALEDLEKYRPYVKLEKGTPFFVQLNQTIDISQRRVNGLAVHVAQLEAATQNSSNPGAVNPYAPDIYPPGDARYRYDSENQTSNNLFSGTPPTAPQMPSATQNITGNTGDLDSLRSKLATLQKMAIEGTDSNNPQEAANALRAQKALQQLNENFQNQ